MAPDRILRYLRRVTQISSASTEPVPSSYGGAAAICGFLYQLLGTSMYLLEAVIDGQAQGIAPDSVTAFLEPRQGGDLLLNSPATACIQFKQRSRKLDVGELTGSVLLDLFSAHCARACDRYELQCTSPLSRTASRLVADLSVSAANGGASSVHLMRLRDRCREVFEQHCKRANSGFDAEYDAFRSRFVVGPILDGSEARRRLAAQLLRRLPYADRVEAEIDRMIGNLMQRAATNDARITGSDLLEIVDLFGSEDPNSSRSVLRTRLRQVLEARGFDARYDARTPIIPSREGHLALVAGPSGCGKTWSLYRTAHELDSAGETVLLIHAPDVEGLYQALRRYVAVQALGHESPIEVSALGSLWRRATGDAGALLWVLWEGCRDVSELVAVHEAGGLGEGIRLIAELAPGHAVLGAALESLETYTVDNFTEAELFDALKRRGIDAGEIPSSVRPMLRMPVLCGIYARLGAEISGWEPTNEYLVLDRFWEQARERINPLASVELKKLARQIVEQRRPLVSDEVVSGAGISGSDLTAFIRAGWLINVDGRVGFAHERLLTWAIAEALAHDYAEKAGGPDVLAGTVGDLMGVHNEKAKLQGLGYLPMDILWLLARRNIPPERFSALLTQFEQEDDLAPHTLYKDLVPTAGPIMSPYLIERIRSEPDDRARYGLPSSIAAALKMISTIEEETHPLVTALAAIDNRCAKAVLLILGADVPLASRLQLMWTEYAELHQQWDEDDILWDRSATLRAALLCVARRDPEWLAELLRNNDDPHQLRLAADLLAALPRPLVAPIWKDASERLLQRIGQEGCAVLIACINQFGDRARVPWLIQQVQALSEESSRALKAVCALDPATALQVIASRPAIPRLPAGRVWLDHILDCDAVRAAQLVRAWIMDRDPTGGSLALLWKEAPERLDAMTAEELFGCLEAATRTAFDTNDRAVHALLGMLASPGVRPEHAALLAASKYQPLVARLKSHALQLAGQVGDETFEAIMVLLRRCRVPAYEHIVLDLLSRSDKSLRAGVAAAYFAPAPKVIARLEDLADDWSLPLKDPIRIDVWEALLALAPARWQTRTVALLAESAEARIHLGLFLLRKGRMDEALPQVRACLARSEPGSRTEAIAMRLAAFFGDDGGILRERAQRRFLQSIDDDDEGRLATFNAMLNDTSKEGRRLIDEYLLGRMRGPSYGSYDFSLLVARLREDDVDPALVAANERFIKRASFFGEDIVDAYVRHSPTVAMSALLERAFAVPSIFTHGQPDAIRILAKIDRDLAEQAFVKSWREHPERREPLATVVRVLGTQALAAMVDCLDAMGGRPDEKLTFRRACLELRRRHVEALPLLQARLEVESRDVRLAVCAALGWVPGSRKILEHLRDHDEAEAVRRSAYATLIALDAEAWAIDNFRAHPRSLQALDYALSSVDPAILTGSPDEGGILPEIRSDIRLATFSEARLAERFRAVSTYKGSRVALRPLTSSSQ